MTGCPCGRPQPLTSCCGPILDGGKPALTAEDLMRSRFTAFATGDAEYLRVSWAPEQCPADVRIDPDRRWTRLEIIATERGRALDGEGIVEFVAHYADGERVGSLHERSRFRRHDGRWVYVDGDHG